MPQTTRDYKISRSGYRKRMASVVFLLTRASRTAGEICELLGMDPDASGRNTIGGILEDLEAEGLVEKVGQRVKPGVSGRPPVVWAWIGDRK